MNKLSLVVMLVIHYSGARNEMRSLLSLSLSPTGIAENISQTGDWMIRVLGQAPTCISDAVLAMLLNLTDLSSLKWRYLDLFFLPSYRVVMRVNGEN